MPPSKKDRYVDAFLDSIDAERNLAARTIANYRHSLAAFRACGNPPPWRECKPEHFRAFLFDLMKKESSRATVRLHFAALRTFYKFLVEQHGLVENPLKEVQLPKAERGLPVVLTARQIDDLLNAPLKAEPTKKAPKWLPVRDAAILELFYSAGLRLSELAGLNVADLDPYSESVRVGIARAERHCAVPAGGAGSERAALPLQTAQAAFHTQHRRDAGKICAAGGPAARDHPSQIAPFLRHASAG